MSDGFSVAYANAGLNILAGTAPTTFANVFIGLFTGNPGPFGLNNVSTGLTTRQSATFGPALAAPVGLGAAGSGTGGSIAAGTYFYVITGVPTGNGSPQTAISNEPAGVVLTGSTSSVVLTWTALSGAAGYQIYRGTSSLGENKLITTIGSGATVTFTDTQLSPAAGTIPTGTTMALTTTPAWTNANTNGEVITDIGVFSAASAGTFLTSAQLLASKTWSINDQLQLSSFLITIPVAQ